MPSGEVTARSEEDWERLLDRVAEGQFALTVICKADDVPSCSAVYQRMERDEEFAARFRARKAMGTRAMVEDALMIADEKVEDAVQVANKRVRIDTRLRLAGKWLADEFGEKLDLTSKGKAVAVTQLNVALLADGTLREVAALAPPDER